MDSEIYQLRPAVGHDIDFLYRVYAGTRHQEMAATGWSEAQAEQFLRFQFTIQNIQYRNCYKNASFDIICRDGEPAGRLYVSRTENLIRIIDIALLPEFRNHGIGTAVLRDIAAEAVASCRPLTLSVAFDNPAVALYRRIGFEITGDDGVYYTLEYNITHTAGTLCTA